MTYIWLLESWFVIIGLRPLGQFLCAIVEEQLQEALLVMPVMTAFDMTCGVITLSCDDFVDFMVLIRVCVELELEVVNLRLHEYRSRRRGDAGRVASSQVLY